MSDIAIRVDNLSKRYRIGARQPYKTFREAINGLLAAPLRRSARGHGENNGTLFWALDDVSFQVQRGEIVGIIGRNGAGKSTLLKILSRITEPTKGRVEIFGRVGSLLEVGTGFHPELTGRENIYLNGEILGMKHAEIDGKFEEIVSFAEIEKFLDTPVKHYSSGMYTRLAFAVAAHLEPEILIVDEVLAVGDAQFQQKCMGRMGQVAREGRTVLFVSHNLSAIRDLCQHAIWLDRGRIRATGSAASITGAYLAEPLQAEQPAVFSNQFAAIESAVFKDDHEKEVDVVDPRTPWSLRVNYRLFTALRAGISIRMQTLDGLVVFDAHEFVRGAELRPPGRYSTTYDLSELKLAPGVYYLSIYVMAHGVAVYLLADGFMRFTVVGSLIGFGGTVAPFDIAGFFLVQPPVRTEMLPAAAQGELS